MRVLNHEIEEVAFWWTAGVAIAYLFLAGLIIWLVFQGVLLYQAFLDGNFSYINWKLSRYLYMAIAYFALGGFLKIIRFI